jgi:hypothetical protein
MESTGESTHATALAGPKANPPPAETTPDKAAAALSKAAVRAFKPTPSLTPDDSKAFAVCKSLPLDALTQK